MKESIHQLKVTLVGSRPPVWRRIQVASSVLLGELHHTLQSAMGWENYHLHVFEVNGVQYGEPHPDDWHPVRNEARITLKGVAPRAGDGFMYTYDFGDNWEHRVLVEKILPAEPGKTCPLCLAGKRACPPEDCGGVWGYQELLVALADPQHPDHDQYREWVPEDFDPESFDPTVATMLMQPARAAGAVRR